ncbi:molecular chaperone Hsp33, partial [Calderihabitans maritimus]
NGYGFER